MNKQKILLIMHSSVFRDNLIHQLGLEGFDVILDSNGFHALEKIRKYSVNSIVTLLNMPQFDGLELILTLRDLKIVLPIIVVSFNDSEIENEIIKAGATAFFQYPVQPDSIIALLKQK